MFNAAVPAKSLSEETDDIQLGRTAKETLGLKEYRYEHTKRTLI